MTGSRPGNQARLLAAGDVRSGLLAAAVVVVLGVVPLVSTALQGERSVRRLNAAAHLSGQLGGYGAVECMETALRQAVPAGSRVFIVAKDQNELFYQRTAEAATPWATVVHRRKLADKVIVAYVAGAGCGTFQVR